MVPTHRNARSEGKQFRLVKYFAYASFFVLIVFSFPFSVVISQKAKDILIKSYENYALLLGQNLSHQVYQNFSIPVIARYGRIILGQKEQYVMMDRVVKYATHSFNIDLVNMYDILNGVISYSTDPGLIGKKVKENEGYKRAKMGEHSSGILSEVDDFWGRENNRIEGKKKIRTYIPYRGVIYSQGEKRELILGVIELIQDMTPQYESIVRLQYLIFGISILFMGLIFTALLLIVLKAERLIEQRAEEQRELEAQLHQSERLAALGEMVAGVSHEIKTPLGIIHSTAELLGGNSDADETQKRLSGVITEESSRLNRIVTEFLDFARPQVPDLKDCYLDEIIQKNISFLHPELEKKGIIINDNLNGRSFKLRADHELLYRALLNIFMNAIQSMETAGYINISVDGEKDHYRVVIEDAGCGITQESEKKIFNPFFTTKETGTGLGLSIVKKIIEGHEGIIGIESIEGMGTRVILHLPRNI